MRHALALCMLLALTWVMPASADVTPYSDPANQGIQAFQGNLALNFDVQSPITVTSLGVFNASGSGTITGTIQVVIFNTITNAEVTPVVTFHGAYTPGALGFDVFQAIAPVVLGVGSYEVDAVGFSASDLNGNINFGTSGPLLDGGGALMFTGASYDQNTSLDKPLTCPGCMAPPQQTHQFDAGTFKFTTGSSATPEPGTLLLLGIGLTGMSRMVRRKLCG